MKRLLPGVETQTPSMPISTGSPLQTTFPSFMSVFGNSSTAETNGSVAQSPNKALNTERRACLSNYTTSIRRDSASTFESAESSPTTTVSTIASSLTDPSPNSSPESPNLSSKLTTGYPRRDSRQSSIIMERKEQFSNSFPTLPGIEKSDLPQKKMRNMKNLSVNTTASNRPASSQLPKLGMTGATASMSNHASSAPPTPAFIVPPKAPRRKPSNLGLTITTPDSNASTAYAQLNIVPQTPSDPQIKTLRRLQTSSDAPLHSPTLAPEGGMRLPPFNAASTSNFGKAGPPLSISPGSVSSPIKKQTLEHVKEEPGYEVPLSQEVKSPAYPQGPVCIYDPYVYLYLEPSRIEASEFDVILNVAREVLNPFLGKEPSPARKMVDKGVQVSFDTADKGVQTSFEGFDEEIPTRSGLSEPQTTASVVSFPSAFEAQTETHNHTAPNTPKAIRPQPEYIHIPWDHNTNVVEDLLRLCELIDDRVQQEKKILIHCQCGVSRSASLVVAYGMYKNPELTVQEAYDAVKNRSKWIGPNMNLIYQLSDFKGKLAKSIATGAPTWQSLRGLGSDWPDVGRSLNPGSANVTRQRSSTSVSVMPQTRRLSTSAPTPSYHPPGSAQLLPSLRLGDVTPGPISAPADYQSSPEKDRQAISSPGRKVQEASLAEDPSRRAVTSREPEQVLSPTVQQSQPAPVGAVAQDLQEVAKDLDHEGKHSSAGPSQQPATIGVESATLAPPESWPSGESGSSWLTSKSSISNLKIGFSRLFSRRQPTPQLPLQQNAPNSTSTQEISAPVSSLMHDDIPPTPSVLSPRAAGFTASPFHRTAAGDLAGSSTFEQGLMSPKAIEMDPRSPHPKGEAPIRRNILDVI